MPLTQPKPQTSFAPLLCEQVAALQNKVRELGARRTLNQKRVSDANLATHRARVAQTKLESERESLQSFWGDGIEAAERTKDVEAELAAMTEQMKSLKNELDARVKEIASLEAVIKPPKVK